MDHLTILLRSFGAFVVLLLITRMLGKQTLYNMNFHEFVTAVILGAIAANLAFNEKIQITHLLISMGVFTGTSFLLSKIVIRNRKLRMLAEGTPTVLIEGGKILEDNLKKNKLTLDTLNQMLRQKDIFDMNEVEYAILEINGQISTLKKKEHKTATVKDLKKGNLGSEQFPIELIMDGNILEGNLEANQLSKKWLLKLINAQGKKVKDIFYAVKGTDGQVYFDFYSDKVKHPIDIE